MKRIKNTWRYFLVVLVVLVVFSGLAGRVAFLHLGEHDRFKDRVKRIRRMEHSITVARGRILDRTGMSLAMDLPMKNVCVDPKVINSNGHVRFVGHYLAQCLDVEPNDVFRRLNRKERRFEYIKKFVMQETVDKVLALHMKGVFFEETSKRHYPYDQLMCHIVGFANMEGVGSAGVEMRLNSYLRGIPGWRVSEKDGKHHEIYGRRSLDIEPTEGADVYLTLDVTVQHMLEKSLAKAMEEHHAKAAWAIVQRVRTGEILAMASLPNYDLNQYSTSKPENRRNRSIGINYEPGSTFKVAVIAAAINEGVVSRDDVVDCENGYWTYKRIPLRDYHAYGNLNVADVLKKSSNIGAAKISLKLGPRKLERYLRDFGVGQKTGIDLPGEERGSLQPERKWSGISITRIAMGHEVSVTGLQMLNMVSCIANDGFLMRPLIVSKVIDSNGRKVFEAQSEMLSRPITAETSKEMRKLLARVVAKGGTGRRAAIQGYQVAGKTGTAQKIIDGHYSNHANVASFVGFFPAEDPEIAMIVVVDEPQPKHTGGAVAAPVFAEVGEQLVRYLSTRPEGWSNMSGVAVQSESGNKPYEEYASISMQ